MPGEDRVSIAKAKGRPMLSWVGKWPLREVRAFPSQLVERFAPETRAGVVADNIEWSDWPDRFDYDLEAPESDRPAAVRITDMLGEEILAVEERV